MDNRLFVTLDGPHIAEEGVPVSAIVKALQGVQDAMRLMVGHLGKYQAKLGQPPKWVQEQSQLRLAATHPDSLVVELKLDSPRRAGDTQNDLGSRGLEAFQNWDGTERSTLPKSVADRLYAISSSLPNDVQLWFGNADRPRKVPVRRTERYEELEPDIEETALLHGWLKEVNWDKRTAALHRYRDRKVPLRFGGSLDEEMRQSANRFVVVKGRGLLSDADHWRLVTVTNIEATRPHYEQFDLEAFLNNPNPKIFDPDKVVTASEPFDVDEFNRIIREGRDVENEDHLI